jgi:diketogulonate reductase-like aldo/keto reductase
LKKAFEEGLVKREDLFFTGKLWNSDHDVDIVPQACDHSLKNLGLDYFDLYLIHFPIAWKHTGLSTPGWGSSELGDTPLIDTWRAMEKLVDAGKCKSIGVSNFPMMLLHDLVNQARVPISCNQIEMHAYYTRESLVNYCLSRDICVTAHTPLGGGVSQKEMWQVSIPLDDPVVKTIAESHGKSPAQVLLRFLLQRGIVVLPKSIKPHRMAENISVFDFSLTDDDMTAIMGLDKYTTAKTNPNPLGSFLGGPDAFCPEGTDIFD